MGFYTNLSRLMSVSAATSILAVGMPVVAQQQSQYQYQWNLPGQSPRAQQGQYLCFGVEPGTDIIRDLSQAPANLMQTAMQALAARNIAIQNDIFISFNSDEENGTVFYEFQAYQRGSYCGVEVDVNQSTGQVDEIELEITPSELPQPVQQVLQQRFPQGIVYSYIERSLRLRTQPSEVYEIEFYSQGQELEAEITPQGEVLLLESQE